MSARAISPHKILTINDVMDLGIMLINIADQYPTTFLTERDFYPLVVAYLTGLVPGFEAEAQTKGGRMDFHPKGHNPTWLELAVQPREFKDNNAPDVTFSGHEENKYLFAYNNASEISKLMAEPKGRTRFLLLVNLHREYDIKTLKKGYAKEAQKNPQNSPVCVVYVSRHEQISFSIGRKIRNSAQAQA